MSRAVFIQNARILDPASGRDETGDLLMIDGRMPNLDGPAAIGAIRALPIDVARVPIVAVIGGDAEEAQECLAAGADAVLRKPVSVAAVARGVADAVAIDRIPSSVRAIA